MRCAIFVPIYNLRAEASCSNCGTSSIGSMNRKSIWSLSPTASSSSSIPNTLNTDERDPPPPYGRTVSFGRTDQQSTDKNLKIKPTSKAFKILDNYPNILQFWAQHIGQNSDKVAFDRFVKILRTEYDTLLEILVPNTYGHKRVRELLSRHGKVRLIDFKLFLLNEGVSRGDNIDDAMMLAVMLPCRKLWSRYLGIIGERTTWIEFDDAIRIAFPLVATDVLKVALVKNSTSLVFYGEFDAYFKSKTVSAPFDVFKHDFVGFANSTGINAGLETGVDANKALQYMSRLQPKRGEGYELKAKSALDLALLQAAQRGFISLLRILIESNVVTSVDVTNIQNNNSSWLFGNGCWGGYTPLILAARNGHFEIVKYLVSMWIAGLPAIALLTNSLANFYAG